MTGTTMKAPTPWRTRMPMALPSRIAMATRSMGMVEKADVADRMLMATVTGDGVAAGETVIFTFQNATASADAGPSTFQVYYDGAKVESDDDVVLVQSGEGATMLALSSEEDTFTH